MFALLQQLRISKSKGNPAKLSAFKTEIENKQRIAWINIIKKEYNNDASSFNFNKITRLCLRYFHLSTIYIDKIENPY